MTYRSTRAFLFGLLGAFLIAAAPAADQQRVAPELAEPRHDLPGLPNFAKVSDDLYRGAQPSAEGFRRLKTMGVKTVVNLRSFHSDRRKLRGTGLRYAHIYCKAWHPEDEDTIEFLKIMRDPDNHPVFVHCQQGADRTGVMVAAYRVVEQGWTIEDAVEETHNFGFHPVWRQISRYLRKFDGEVMREKVEEADAADIDVVE
jgi:protein tyrosine/serine phosphatase